MKKIITILLMLPLFMHGQNLRKLGSTGATSTLYGEFFYLNHPTYGVADSLKLADKKYVDQALVSIGAGSAFGIDSLVIGGASGSVLYIGTNGLLQESPAVFVYDSTNGRVSIGGVSPAARLAITTNELGVTQTRSSGIILINTKAAAAGAQQKSPGLWIIGQGYKTNATAASQEAASIIDVLPVQGAANPAANLQFNFAINGGAITKRAQLSSTAGFLIGDIAPFPDATNLAYAVGDQTRGLWSAGSNTLNARGGNSHIYFGSSTGLGFYTGLTLDQAAPERYFHFKRYVSNGNAIEYTRFTTVNNGGTGSAGLGQGREVQTENGSSNLIIHGRDAFVYTSTTNGAESGDYYIDLINAGSLAEKFRVTSAGLGRFAGGLELGVVGDGVNTDSVLVINNTVVKKLAVADLPGGSGITSINSETGPAIGITSANGIGIATTTNTITATLGGTLNTDTDILGAANALRFGSSGSKVSVLSVNSASTVTLTADTYVQLFGGVQLGSQTASDANYTIPDNISYITLPEIAASRTVTMPAQGSGKMYIIHNTNTSGNSWDVASNLLNAAGGAITALTNQTVYIIISNGTNFIRIN